MPETPKAFKAATAQEIRAILGPANTDDEMIFVVRETGASKEEVLQAFTWLNDDDYLGKGLRLPMNSRVRAVYEILQESQNSEPER